jgi:hypothetical protein
MIIKHILVNGKKINVVDYATHNVDYKKLHLFNLNSLKPKWIPWVDEEYFVNNKFFICPIKWKDNKYLFSRASKYKDNHDRIVLVNLDVLVLTQNYYFEKMKRDINNSSSLIFNSHVSYFYKRGQHKIRKLSSNKMSGDQMELAELIYGSKELAWEKYPELLKEISYKQNDLRHHCKDHQNIYSKGQETSFGIKNINNSLFYELGIGVKLQNGDAICNSDISLLRDGILSFYETIFNLKEWAMEFHLNISFSKEKKMYARDAVGVFIPSYKIIGVSVMGNLNQTLSHEFAHFIDFWIGKKQNRYYSSDDSLSEIGIIASTYRNNLNKSLTSEYLNRTKECFARAIEQYYAIKNSIFINNKKGSYVEEYVFNQKIAPLIENLLIKLKG